MNDTTLPPAFEDLQPWVADWALPNERERFIRLHSVTLEQLRAFYDAVLPRLDAVLDHLDNFDADALPGPERILNRLAMTFAETAHPIDLRWKATDFDDAYPWQKFQFHTVSLVE